MKSERFFAWVNKANSLVWFSAGVVVLLALLVLVGGSVVTWAGRLMTSNDKALPTAQGTNIHDDKPVASKVEKAGQESKAAPQPASLGEFQRTTLKNLLVAPVFAEPSEKEKEKASNGSSMSGSSRYASDGRLVNYYYLDTTTRTGYSLRNSNEGLLHPREFDRNGDEDNTPHKANKEPIPTELYVVVKTDTNQDGVLSLKDTQTVAISETGGKNYREVLANVSDLQRAWRIDGKLVLIYKSNDQLMGAELSETQRDLPIVTYAIKPNGV